MKTTSIPEARRNERRQMERRRRERRANLEFGSPEWIEYVQQNYLMWPKYDRRNKDRRTQQRRNLECRRRRQTARIRFAQQQNQTRLQLLSDEEKKALRDIIQGG